MRNTKTVIQDHSAIQSINVGLVTNRFESPFVNVWILPYAVKLSTDHIFPLAGNSLDIGTCFIFQFPRCTFKIFIFTRISVLNTFTSQYHLFYISTLLVIYSFIFHLLWKSNSIGYKYKFVIFLCVCFRRFFLNLEFSIEFVQLISFFPSTHILW